jgi:chorismate lyase/3-hydroxybenzoate synthase
LQVPFSSLSQKLESPFAVCYADRAAAASLLRQTGPVLGVVGYGSERPEFLPPSCLFVAAPLLPATSEGMFEIWTTTSPARQCQVRPVLGACGDDVAFGAIRLDETGKVSLEAAVEEAYLAIFDFLEETGFRAPIRFWNYLTSITGEDGGLERYMRFNIGRHRAFSARLRQAVPPVASGVGGHVGASVIYFLAAREAARAIENPRQVSAYEYPPAYGPSSPSFSRASIHAKGPAKTLFISGTASIVGHETRHAGDLTGQVAETAENLRALIGAAGQAGDVALGQHWAVKVYLRDAADREAVDPAINAVFGANSQRLYLRGDICRSDLLVEIEALSYPS